MKVQYRFIRLPSLKSTILKNDVQLKINLDMYKWININIISECI